MAEPPPVNDATMRGGSPVCCPSPDQTTLLADNLAMDTSGSSQPTPVQLNESRFGGGSSLRSSPTTSEIEAATAAAAAVVANNTPLQQERRQQDDDDPLGRGKRKSPVGTTTARNKKTKKTQTKIKLGCRIYSTRKTLFLCGLLNENQQNAIRSFPQNFRLHGTVKSGKGTSGYNVEYDLFPAGDKLCRGVLRNRMVTLKEGEEEIDQPDSVEAMAEIQEEEEEKKKRQSVYHQSIDGFGSLSKEEMETAKLFEMKYGNGDNEVIEWEILPDNVHITEDNDHMEWPDDLELKKDINFDDNNALADIFFNDFFPCITGHAKLIDEFHTDMRSPMFQTVQDEKIAFHQERDEDPDWVVKQCYLLMIAAVTEAEIGVDNLWKRGESGGRHKHPDFGQYVPKNVFKAFTCAAAFVFTNRKWWYADKRDRDWDIFIPVLESFNEKRRALFHSVLLMLDESMSAWKPKTSKTGGLPNLTNEPRKPVDLGSQLRNGVECFTGVLAFQDVFMGPEKQRKKKYYYSDVDAMLREPTSLPKKEDMSAHTSEVLRQVEGAGLPVGGWVGGDAWFGSVMTVVELKKRLGVHSTFIVKNNKNYFPMEVLYNVLKEARHGSHPAGHWVVMRAVISHVPVIAIAYAWSQKGVSYFISTCGKTTPSPHKYEAKFEDDWGNTSFREIPRPDILHVLYEYVPLIDEHNKSRQSILAMEKRWQTRNPWFRLITTIVGMSIVDMYRLYRHHKIKVDGWTPQQVDALRIIRFTDLICGNLRSWKYQHRRKTIQGREKPVLDRIRDKEGNTTTEPTSWQKDNRNNTVGNPITHHCFICRRYLTDKGTTVYRKTSHWCKDCHMPLCEKSRVGLDGGRDLSCVDKHCCSDDEVFACSGMFNKNTAVPKDKQISLHPRRSLHKDYNCNKVFVFGCDLVLATMMMITGVYWT